MGADTWQHVLTGIFISDFLKDQIFLRNVSQMLEYTWTYYAHYPALGLLHWPPLFQVIEGIYFLFAPISEPLARFLIIPFFLVAIIFYHRIMISLFDPSIALVAAIFFILSPLVLTYARIVSLEIPSLALSLGAIYFFMRYMQTSRFKDGIWASLLTAGALLTKQTCVFLLVFYGMLLGKEYFHAKNFKNILWFFAIIVVLAGPFYFCALYFQRGPIIKDLLTGITIHNPYTTLSNYYYYIVSTNNQLPFILLPLIAIYLIFYFLQYKKAASYSVNFLIIWALSCYVVFTLIAQKMDRYIIYWIPALTGLAAVGLMKGTDFIIQRINWSKPILRFLIPLPIIMITFIQALALKPPYTSGYNEVASFVLSQASAKGNEIVFYDGEDHRNFTFSIRKYDHERRIFVFRSSKYLYATNIYPEYETWNIRTKKQDILTFFKQYGIRFVTLSSTAETNIPAVSNLRTLVENDDKFILLRKFSVINSDYGNVDISVYLFKDSTSAVHARELEIPMPTLGKIVKIRLPGPATSR